MKKRPPRQKIRRERTKRIRPSKQTPARHFRVFPDPRSPVAVDVYVFRTRAQMLARLEWFDGVRHEPELMGLCRTWHAPRQRLAGITRPQQVAAWIFYNVADLRDKPSEIVSHECAHAAMGYARYRQANLRRMVGEEVMCHALGRLVAQVNHNLYAMGVFAS